MVLQENRQYHLVNKYINSFLLNHEKMANGTSVSDEWKKSGSTKLKSLMQKDGSVKPKRVISKYLYFCTDERPKILSENPGIGIKECTCELGRRWKDFLDNPDKERMNKYKTLFDKDKERYMSEKKVVEKKHVPPNSAYLAFCIEQRKTNPKIRMKELGVLWAIVKQNPTELAKYELMINKQLD